MHSETRQEALWRWFPTLAVALVYLWLAPPWVLGGDNGEFATLAEVGGVAHPSGYPLFVLWLQATSWLPAQSPAHAAGLATALLGVAQVWAILKAARAWGASPVGSAMAGVIYAMGPLPLLIFTQAEVFALNGLMAALIVWLCAPAGPVKGMARTAWLGWVAGLAIANHLSSVWLAPLGLFGACLGLWEAEVGKQRAAGAGLAVLGVLAGLSLYLTMILQVNGGWTWGHPRTLGDVWHHLLRKDYGTFTLHGGGKEGQGLANLAAMGRSLVRAWLWGGPALALLGVIAGLGERGVRRWAWVAFGGAVLAAGPGFILMFNIVPEGTALHIVERFHILPSLLLVPWVALGLDRLGGALARVPALGNLGRPAMLGVWVACAGGVAAALSLEGVREGHSPAVERYVLNTLRSLPPNTVLIGSGDHRSFGFLYAQEVLKERPDVLYADSIMMNYPWYRAKIERRFGAPLLPPGPEPGTVRMARTVLKAKRPLYLAAVTNGNLVGALPNYPLGTCIRVLPEGEPMPDPVTVAQQNDALFRRFDLDYVIPQRSDEGWAVEVHKDYARPWEGLAAVFERAGDRASAKAAWDRARSVAPWLPEKY